ncbi:hypothetical protein NDU88_008640 [Pleurodeles waltl]|uniref:Uncharacterized protein n=1 Tax=Pleurodeles waltl TaxID=8319 RepID=A0AAV7N9F7_PLEWA|nr:hypothetical protein NDU88_008640 [Pleurodeles waltl]
MSPRKPARRGQQQTVDKAKDETKGAESRKGVFRHPQHRNKSGLHRRKLSKISNWKMSSPQIRAAVAQNNQDLCGIGRRRAEAAWRIFAGRCVAQGTDAEEGPWLKEEKSFARLQEAGDSAAGPAWAPGRREARALLTLAATCHRKLTSILKITRLIGCDQSIAGLQRSRRIEG